MTKPLLSLNDRFTYRFGVTRGYQHRPYYQATIPLRTLTKLVRYDNQGAPLERSQREMSEKRARDFADYLLGNAGTSRCFIIPTLTGCIDTPVNSPDPRFLDIYELTNTPRPENEYSSVGELLVHMDSTVKLFDGQHRTGGIELALDLLMRYPERYSDVDLGGVSVPVMLYDDLSLAERQLFFTDINMNLTKPTASISLSYDKRDEVAQLALTLATELPCFTGVVDFERNVVSNRSPYLFPLKAIYDSVRHILGVKPSNKHVTISDADRDRVSKILTMMSRVMGWSGLKMAEESAQSLRERFIHTHAVMLKAAAVAGEAIDTAYGGIEHANLAEIEALDFTRQSKDFTHRCICPLSGNMIANQRAATLAANKLQLAANCPLSEKAAQLERDFVGEFEQPIISKTRQYDAPPATSSADHVALETVVTERDIHASLTSLPFYRELSDDMAHDAVNRILTVLQETHCGDGKGHVHPDRVHTTLRTLFSTLTNTVDHDEFVALLSNIRRLRRCIHD